MTDHSPKSKFDLSKLGDTYEILSPIQEDGASSTYLARHRELGRDVTITAVRVSGDDGNNTLTHFAADARLLAGSGHDSIVPVIEGRWLGDDTFAVVRVLARGSTLAQVIAQEGAFPPARVAATLREVHQGLEWARQNGVVHRNVTPETVGFQQGSGRVMMSLGLAPLPVNSLPDACGDARTIGALAWSMLTGRSYGAASTDDKTLADLRPGLSPKVVAQTDALLACTSGSAVPDIPAYINLLSAEPEAPAAAPTVAATAAAAGAAAVAATTPTARSTVSSTPVRPPTPPVGSTTTTEEAVIVRRRSHVPAAMLVVVLIVIAGAAVWKWRQGGTYAHTAAGDVDSTTIVATNRPSPMEAAPPGLPAGTIPPATVDTSALIVPAPQPMPTPYPAPSTTYPPPVMPGATPAPVVSPPVQTAPTTPPPTVPTEPRDLVNDASMPACQSPDSESQRQCFNAALVRQDVELNRVWGDLISSMRRRENVPDDAPDPESVRDLRAVQRRWVEERDIECKRRGEGREGAQWALPRAACFAEYSAQRTRELRQMMP